MERSKIPMLSRFDAISHIMPYYGQTHRAFLLLSSLCSETREKLDEFYYEFIASMKKYWSYFKVNSDENLIGLFLPNDLFEISISFYSKEFSDALINFIENLRDSEGWYFNSHYMHSKIKIRDPIKVHIRIIKRLYTYVDVLKSTQAILCKRDTYSSKVKYESSTLDINCSHALFNLKRIDIKMHFVYIYFTNYTIILFCFKIK